MLLEDVGEESLVEVRVGQRCYKWWWCLGCLKLEGGGALEDWGRDLPIWLNFIFFFPEFRNKMEKGNLGLKR